MRYLRFSKLVLMNIFIGFDSEELMILSLIRIDGHDYSPVNMVNEIFNYSPVIGGNVKFDMNLIDRVIKCDIVV